MPDYPTPTVSHDSPQADPLLNLPDLPPLVHSYEVHAAPPIRWPGLPPELLAPLIEAWRAKHAAGQVAPAPFNEPMPAELVTPPEEFKPAMVAALRFVADHFGLPFHPDTLEGAIARYTPGASTSWHVDGDPNHPAGARRCVAFSIQLNDDFTGGELEVHPAGAITMSPGDVVGFTSRTWHRVTPVTSGQRFVLLGFGGYNGTPREAR